MDLLTITSHEGSTGAPEAPLDAPGLFPLVRAGTQQRAHAFEGKQVFFVSARVHPGETPGSHLFNGVLRFLLDPKDPRARALRSLYVFKLVPMLNPDGVVNGNYRCRWVGVHTWRGLGAVR